MVLVYLLMHARQNEAQKGLFHISKFHFWTWFPTEDFQRGRMQLSNFVDPVYFVWADEALIVSFEQIIEL